MQKNVTKLLVFSDSHGRAGKMSAAFSEHPDADAVIFLGDGLRDAVRVFCGCEKTVAAVCGNCDSSGDIEAAKTIGAALPEITLDIGGVRVMCAHGHRYGVKSGLSRIAEAAKARGAGLVLFGHTHVPTEVHLDGALLFNPGSIASGSYGIIYIQDGAILCSHGTV